MQGAREAQERHNSAGMTVELDRAMAARAFGAGHYNFIRRGADGSLVLSADRWRLARVTPEAFEFVAEDPAAPPLDVSLVDVRRMVWEQLPRQRVRSQVRFYFDSGDLWTFSGTFEAPTPLPSP
jgi:hypothetical protein